MASSAVTELHVVFGAGQVGQPLARLLLDAGKRVRVAKRSPGGVPPGADVIQGDATDAAFCADAAEGAATIYHCMNPPYDTRRWAELVPRWMDNLIAAARRSGARLVVLDNVYMLGRPGGRRLDEDSPVNPNSRKGEIRARAAERLFDAHRRGELLATAGRASDYYGPGGTLTHVGDQFWRPALKGRRAWVLANPDAVHTYHYIPDVAAGLMTLGGAAADVYGQPWMLPCAPAETMRTLVARFSRELGREIRLAVAPRWLVKAMGIFVPLVREVEEMSYQWDEPFVIDDRRFRQRFQQQPTDVDEAALATVRWARQHYATGHGGG
ncbi:MAG TPA: NAD-dependent epimerase/dehydratase family protein [Vicinamibacterales bacterium]|nr:NAD-dependent epimerase/dehydratase family protein [Vicinamibacterales bacterium]